jgi:apolipoprotein N-acyltransferase
VLQKILGFSDAWTPGNRLVIFKIPLTDSGISEEKTIRFSTPICFEDAFGDVCRELFWAGSEVFINLTNDSWSLTKSAEYQHYAIATYRSIELRSTLVRSTNSGYSVVIDPRGMVLKDLPLFETASLFTEIPVYERVITPYAAFGEWFIYMALIICCICMCYVGINAREYAD